MLRIVGVVIFLVLIVVALAAFFYIFQWESQEDVTIIIDRGDSVSAISEKLASIRVVPSKFLFKIVVLFFDYDKLKAGKYDLQKGSNMIDVVKTLIEGSDLFDEKIIKITEGWTIKDIDQYLSKKGFIKIGEFVEESKNIEKYRSGYNFLQDKRISSLEGYLFPDTYKIYTSADASVIIKKMLSNFELRLMQQVREEIIDKKLSMLDVVILASIIEKEVRLVQDKEIVAGIFLKRMANNMPLQADSTLNYFTGNSSFRLNSVELKIDSKYNTYIYRGLPPTPISNPGLKSIQAAVYPKKSPYLYFLSKETGETVFSATFSEHVANKRKWLAR